MGRLKRVHSDYKKANKKLKWHKVQSMKEHWVRELAIGIKRHDPKQIKNASIRLTEVDKQLLIIIERKIARGR